VSDLLFRLYRTRKEMLGGLGLPPPQGVATGTGHRPSGRLWCPVPLATARAAAWGLSISLPDATSPVYRFRRTSSGQLILQAAEGSWAAATEQVDWNKIDAIRDALAGPSTTLSSPPQSSVRLLPAPRCSRPRRVHGSVQHVQNHGHGLFGVTPAGSASGPNESRLALLQSPKPTAD